MSLTDALLLDPYPFEIWVADRSEKGSGTLNDPYGAASAADFDALINSLPEYTRIHLGKGEFETVGYYDGGTTGLRPKRGMRITGAGVNVTTLKMVGSFTADKHYFAIGHPLAAASRVDFLEISDLTIDCNLPTTPSVAAGAVRLMGNHVRVHRVKVKNWGTKSLTQDVCFVLSLIIADPEAAQAADRETANAGLDQCIVIDPSTNNTGKAVLLHAGAKDLNTHLEAIGKAPYIRNCFVDGGTVPLSTEFRGIAMGSCRGGIVEGNQIHSVQIGGPYVEKLSTRDIWVRNNWYKNVHKGPFWNMGSASLGGLSPSVDLTSLVQIGGSQSKTVEATTSASDHKLVIGSRVNISGATPSQYNGLFEVTDNMPSGSTNKFRYEALTAPTSTPASPVGSMQVLFGVDKAVVEGNTVELAKETTGEVVAVHFHDTALSGQNPAFVHGELIIRNNKIRYLDGAFAAGYAGYGVQTNGGKRVFVWENVIEAVPDNPIKESRCGTANYFNNQSPSGALIQGYDENTSTKYSELETDAEDALLMTLI